MSDTKLIKNSKLARNRYADDLKYLDTDSKTSVKLNDKIETMLTNIFGNLGRRFTNRSPFKILLNAAKELQKLNFYWLAESINEHNILLAENIESVQGIASAHGFQRNRGVSASGLAKLQILSTLTNISGSTSLSILNGAIVKNDTNSLMYFVNLRLPSYVVDFSVGAKIDIDLVQGAKQTVQYIGDGNDLQIFEIKSQKIISESNLSITNQLNSDLIQKGLYRELTPNDNAYLLRNGFDNSVTIHFGSNGVGYVPKLGEIITITYVECDGEAGNCLENSEFTILSGFQIDGNDYDISKHAKLSSVYDFINGYSGDSIDITRLNVGAQSTSNVIATPDHVKSYLRAYPQYSVSEVWREPGTAIINALLCPNVKQLASLNSYFNIPNQDFIISQQDKDLIKLAIFNDKRNVLVSNIDFKDYTIAEFGIFVFVKLEKNSLITDNLKQSILSIISDVLVQSWHDNVRQIHKSDFITVLVDSISEVTSIDIKFISSEDNAKYIDEIGDIDTRELSNLSNNILTNTQFNYVIPVIRAIEYDSVQLSHAVKILVENISTGLLDTNETTWIEI